MSEEEFDVLVERVAEALAARLLGTGSAVGDVGERVGRAEPLAVTIEALPDGAVRVRPGEASPLSGTAVRYHLSHTAEGPVWWSETAEGVRVPAESVRLEVRPDPGGELVFVPEDGGPVERFTTQAFSAPVGGVPLDMVVEDGVLLGPESGGGGAGEEQQGSALPDRFGIPEEVGEQVRAVRAERARGGMGCLCYRVPVSGGGSRWESRDCEHHGAAELVCDACGRGACLECHGCACPGSVHG